MWGNRPVGMWIPRIQQLIVDQARPGPRGVSSMRKDDIKEACRMTGGGWRRVKVFAAL